MEPKFILQWKKKKIISTSTSCCVTVWVGACDAPAVPATGCYLYARAARDMPSSFQKQLSQAACRAGPRIVYVVTTDN
jgi:hypothetical protein